MKNERTSLFSIGVASLSSLLFGLGLTSFGITETISKASDHSTLSTVAIANIFLGGVVGVIFLEFFPGCSTKGLITASSMLNLLGYILILFRPEIYSILLSRVIIGVGVGISGLVVPSYIFELSPVAYKGVLSNLHPMNLNLGIVVGQGLGKFNTPSLWVYGIGTIALVSLFSTILSCFIKNIPTDKSSRKSILQLLRKPKAWKSVVIVMILHLSQHLSGVDYVVVFLRKIQDTNPLWIMSLSIPSNLVCSILLDKYGRKPLMILSCTLIATSCFLKNGIILFVVGYNLGLSNIPWLVPNELAPPEYVAPLSSLGVQTNWLSAFFVVQIFFKLTESIGEKIWYVYGGLMVMVGLFTLLVVPETKGKKEYDFVQ